MSQNKAFFLYQLHIFNLPMALILRLFGAVRVYKYVGFCERFLTSNIFKQIPDFTGINQWRDTQSNCYLSLKKSFLSLPEVHTRFKRTNIDCSINYLQRFFIEYEQYLFFQTLSSNHLGQSIIVDHDFSRLLKHNYPSLYQKDRVSKFWSRIFLPFDKVFIIKKLFFIFLKSINQLLDTNKRIKIKQTKNIVMGLSSAELGYHKKESDFSWLVKNGILESKDVIYIFQNNIPKEARKLNHERGIIAYSERELLSTIESSKKIILIVNQISSLLKHLVKCDFEGLYLYKVETEFRFWSPLIKKINPINVLYSLAQGWPELHIVPFLSHHNIKTSNWFYGAGEFAYKTSSSQFNDNNIRFCLREADQTLVWNELTRKLLNDRQWIQTKNKIHVYGPVMNGCWNNLKLQKNIEKFTIVVFDSESMKSHARLQRGHGPFYELSTQEGFYKGIQDLLKKYPDAKFIIKGKKPITNNPLYHDVSSLNELKNMANGNVTFEELKTDPLSLISIADLVISSPFTSPGLAAIALGVPSIYYDSTKFCKSTFKNAFDSITLNTSQELINVVEKVKNNEFKFTEDALAYFNQISPDEMSSKIKDLL